MHSDKQHTPRPPEPVGGRVLATLAVWGTVLAVVAIIGSLIVWALAAIWGAIL